MVGVTGEFLGGLDQIFQGVKKSKLSLDNGSTIKDLLPAIVDKHLDNPTNLDMFLDDDRESVRAGILVLINDVDWELEDELNYELQDNDVITFTSTLHGG